MIYVECAGFVVKIEKSQWNPSQEVEWLGFVINLSKGEFTVPSDKIDWLRVKLSELNSVVLFLPNK